MLMQAAVVGADGIAVEAVAAPRPGDTEILVKVVTASLNRADLPVAAGGRYGAIGGPGTVPGLEWAGEIVEVGRRAAGFAVGDRVMCSGIGGYAQYAVTDARRALPVPPGLDLETAATLPIALTTMHDALITNGGLCPGESVLVLGASSGVGLMALQIARLRGATTIIGSSTDTERRARLPEFGATHVVDTAAPDWPTGVLDATGGAGADLIVDQISGPIFKGTLAAAAIRGRIVNVGRLGGAAGAFDFDQHALKRLRYIGVTFRTRTLDEIAAINRAMLDDLGEAVTSRTLAMPVDSRFPLDRVAEALARMRGNRHFGKILLTVSGD